MHPDHLLFERIKNSDKKAFEQLFNLYYKMLCVHAYTFVKDMDVSRDLVQNVFVKLYDSRATLDIKNSLKSYLYRSVHNACINYLKSEQVHELHHDQVLYQADTIDYEDSLELLELQEQIMVEVNQLPGQCQKIFMMNRFDGMKNAEIALELGISKRTVETQISKALKILRQKLAHLLPAIGAIFCVAEVF